MFHGLGVPVACCCGRDQSLSIASDDRQDEAEATAQVPRIHCSAPPAAAKAHQPFWSISKLGSLLVTAIPGRMSIAACDDARRAGARLSVTAGNTYVCSDRPSSSSAKTKPPASSRREALIFSSPSPALVLMSSSCWIGIDTPTLANWSS